MLKEAAQILRSGELNGNNMVVRFNLDAGPEIFALPTENFYGGGWDVGPTWNYLVLGDPPFLVDTGRTGMAHKLVEMLAWVGIRPTDLGFILLSHGHEDHDGAAAELASAGAGPVRAHPVYDRIIRFYPDRAPPDAKAEFPASCWRCFMPESFSAAHCRDYHQKRSRLAIQSVEGDPWIAGDGTTAYPVPGHSPDSLAILTGSEVLMVGDTLLPDITPFPSREGFFDAVGPILDGAYTEPDEIYGLRAYIRSLRKLEQIGADAGDLLVLPAHRLFFNGHWNEMEVSRRVGELIDHHITRAGDILNILRAGPKTVREIAREHFEAPLLKGFGMNMAENEVVSHCELLRAAGDVVFTSEGRVTATGTDRFETLIHGLTPDRDAPSPNTPPARQKE